MSSHKVILGLFFTFLALQNIQVKEFQISNAPFDEKNPKIHGNIVIWEFEREESTDIYGYDLTTEDYFMISSENAHRYDPAIYGDVVVWVEIKMNGYCIYGRNLSTWEEYEIASGPSVKFHPAIYENIIIWLEDTGKSFFDIFAYNLTTADTLQITNGGTVASAAIYGNIIVWGDRRSDNLDIYGYDLSTSTEFLIRGSSFDEADPTIYENIVIFSSDRSGNADIYGYDLVTGEEFQVTSDPRQQYYPAIHRDLVVWVDERNTSGRQEVAARRENFDIYGQKLSTREEFPITTNQNDQLSPAVYDNVVVWEDYRDCTEKEIFGTIVKTESNIYGCRIPKSITKPDNEEYERKGEEIIMKYRDLLKLAIVVIVSLFALILILSIRFRKKTHILCSKCGAVNASDSIFCGNCGAKL
jgi:beta propeller repeat protein